MEWNLGQDSAVRWSREERLDPAPYWELATGRPLGGKLQSPVASPNELLRFKNAVYQRHNGVWRSPDGQTLPELPEDIGSYASPTLLSSRYSPRVGTACGYFALSFRVGLTLSDGQQARESLPIEVCRYPA